MEANYHQVVTNMKPEVFKIYQLIQRRIKHAESESDFGSIPSTAVWIGVIEELQGISKQIEADPDNWIPVERQDPKVGIVTSANGVIWK